MITATELLKKKSRPLEKGLSDDEINQYLQALKSWNWRGQRIVRVFTFKNYYEVMAFVNALAFIAHAENHHPELIVTYNRCTVKYSTHSLNRGKGGLSENDFICAAKVDALFEQSQVDLH